MKQRHKIEKGRRVATYAVYNKSQETIILPKNQLMVRCQLILQPSEEEYLQEMMAIRQEGEAGSKGKKSSKPREETKQAEEGELSKDWVVENFKLRDNPILERE